MPGPPPKHPSQRRRRNIEGSSSRTLADTSTPRSRPPTLPGSKGLLPETRKWWKTAWASPMAEVWTDADVPALVRLALLHDLTARQFAIVRDGPIPHIKSEIIEEAESGNALMVNVVFRSPVSAAHLGEMRQLEDRLGLSPLSRRRLQWEIERAGAAGEGAESDGDELERRRQERFERAMGGGA